MEKVRQRNNSNKLSTYNNRIGEKKERHKQRER